MGKERKIWKSKPRDEIECLACCGIEKVQREELDLAEAAVNRTTVLNPSSISAVSPKLPFRPKLEETSP
ncbi:unnamed protein product [Arabis nemorensis]|uniref:Uncharacterized protein n=1 Tax=Arabis nemorensis TaxID=586526 RepID=A0A565C5T9_9BRAS|nr:unnamed protein product [Arabis nemorensis]